MGKRGGKEHAASTMARVPQDYDRPWGGVCRNWVFHATGVLCQVWKNVQLPQNYVWQAAAPAYAQVSAGTNQCTVSPTVGALALSHNSRTLSLSLSLSTHRQRSVCGRIYSSTAILSTRPWTTVACPRPPSLKTAGTKGASVVYSCRSSVLSSDSICLCCTAVTCKLSSRGNRGGDRC